MIDGTINVTELEIYHPSSGNTLSGNSASKEDRWGTAPVESRLIQEGYPRSDRRSFRLC